MGGWGPRRRGAGRGRRAHGSRNGEGEPEPPVPVYKGLTFRNCGLGARERTVRGGGNGSITDLFTLGHLGAQPHHRPAFQGPHSVAPTPTPQFLHPTAL